MLDRARTVVERVRERIRLILAWLFDTRAVQTALAFADGFADVFRTIAFRVGDHNVYWLVEWMEPKTDANLSIRAGEHKILEIKKHWAASIWSVLKVIFAAIVWTWATFADLQWGFVDFYWIFFMPFCLAITIQGVWHVAGEFRDRFVITNQRIFRINGVFGKTRASIPIGRILDITAKQPIIGRWLNYGHFVFESAAQIQGLNEITYVRDIDQNEEILRMAIHGDEPHELATVAEEQDDGT
jgi:membrane protein YdbS with pleckstrin-like domain